VHVAKILLRRSIGAYCSSKSQPDLEAEGLRIGEVGSGVLE